MVQKWGGGTVGRTGVDTVSSACRRSRPRLAPAGASARTPDASPPEAASPPRPCPGYSTVHLHRLAPPPPCAGRTRGSAEGAAEGQEPQSGSGEAFPHLLVWVQEAGFT